MRAGQEVHNKEQAHSLSPDAYDAYVAELRKTEFARLGESTYADHAGAALYSERQLGEVFQDLSTGVYSNPHSQHAQLSGLGGSEAVQERARRLTLEMCNASPAEYTCIFTSGATGGMKLVADAFPWSAQSTFTYTRDNHTSVLGMRGPAMRAGASAVAVDPVLEADGAWRFEPCGEDMRDPAARQSPAEPLRNHTTSHLFAYPLESNFDGARYDPLMANFVQQRRCSLDRPAAGQRWLVLLDAAKACSTRPPDLSTCSADFVVLSFYKIFGYPTGLGALLVRKSAAQLLQKSYFGGGTVAACSAESDFVRRREGAAGMEDGTASYLGISAVPYGFRQVERMGGFAAIEQHTCRIARHMAERLMCLRHCNGAPVCTLYGYTDQRGELRSSSLHCSLPGNAGWGPTVTFNVLRADGSFIGYREVEKLASLSDIMLRGGCFCNPGACAAHLGLSLAQIQENWEAGHVCWDDNDLIAGQPTGAIRVSFGFSSTAADALAILAFLAKFFVEGYREPLPDTAIQTPDCIRGSLGTAGSNPLSSPAEQGRAIVGVPAASAAEEEHPAASAAEEDRSEASAMPDRSDDGDDQVADARADRSLGAARRQEAAPRDPPWFWSAIKRRVGRWLAGVDTIDGQHDQSGRSPVPKPPPPTFSSPSDPPLGDTSGSRQNANSAPDTTLQTGQMSSFGHDDRLGAAASLARPQEEATDAPILAGIWVFPIKSCAGCAQQLWPLGPNGLLFDREWALVGEEGEVLTLKKFPQLLNIQPNLDIAGGFMTVRAANMAQPLVIPLPGSLQAGTRESWPVKDTGPEALSQHIRICAESVCSMQVGSLSEDKRVSEWFTQALGCRCRLVQQQPGSRQAVQPHQLIGGLSGKRATANGPSIGFANEAQMLLINERSVADLNARLAAKQAERPSNLGLARIDPERFRPNLLIRGGQPFEEDTWASISLGATQLQIAGPCARCEVICVDPRGGQGRGPEPLLTLASFRRAKGRINFGVLLQQNDTGVDRKELVVGMPLTVQHK